MLAQLESSKALPAPSAVHRLQGKPLRRWWQVGDLFALKRKSIKEDKYQNPSIRAQLLFLLQLPFGMALMSHIAGPSPTTTKMLILAGVAGVAVFTQLAYAFKQHCKILTEVEETGDGIVLKAPFFTRRIHWSELNDFYSVDNDDYLLETTSGEDYVLSGDLTDSAGLFERLRQHVPKSTDVYSCNFRVPIGFIDSATMASFAVILASVFPFLTWLFVRPPLSQETIVTQVAIAVLLVPLSVAAWRIHLNKTAEIFRIGDTSCMVRTRTGRQRFAVDQITAVKKILGYTLVKSRIGWFFLIADKSEPARAKLLECSNTIRLIK